MIPGLPPSSNKLYRSVRGRPILTSLARKYRAKVGETIGQQLLTKPELPSGDVALAYKLDLTVWLENVENKGWATHSSKTRFREFDVDNRIKYLQDCVTRALGIPSDSQILENTARKNQGTPERVVVVLEVIDPAPYLDPIDPGQ